MIATYTAVYLGIGFVVLAWLAYLDGHDVRVAFWLSLLWPLFMVAIPIARLLHRLKVKHHRRIDIQVRRDLSMFGFRRRPEGPAGWALRFFWIEFQTWRTA